MTELAQLLSDLRDEGDELDVLVAGLPAADWATPTPAEGWTIAHQVSHLAWTDRVATIAATDAKAFEAELRHAIVNAETYVEDGAAEGTHEEPAALLQRWRRGRAQVLDALAAVPSGSKLPWYGPPMSPASMATARLMETWAHGLDVAEALGAEREASHRLRHVAHIGVRARNFAFRTRGLAPPPTEFRVELTGPAGELWTWGPADAEQRVTGPALDFCLLATRRRHRDDLALDAKGDDADRWLDIAQAFAGPPGPDRPPVSDEGHPHANGSSEGELHSKRGAEGAAS